MIGEIVRLIEAVGSLDVKIAALAVIALAIVGAVVVVVGLGR